MSSYAVFVTWSDQATGQERKSKPILLRGKSEQEATDPAIAVADFAHQISPRVLVQILDSTGDVGQ